VTILVYLSHNEINKPKKEEIEVLEHLHQNSPNNTVRKRSQYLVLSHQRYKIKELASIFKVSRRTIERWLDSWTEIGG